MFRFFMASLAVWMSICWHQKKENGQPKSTFLNIFLSEVDVKRKLQKFQILGRKSLG
jgi:hypothetical protein